MSPMTTSVLPGILLGVSIAANADNNLEPFCFESTKLCITRKPNASALRAVPLRLNVPEETKRRVVTYVIANVDDNGDAPTDTVNVNAAKITTEIPAGLASLVWATKNPLQAWRIFTPILPP